MTERDRPGGELPELPGVPHAAPLDELASALLDGEATAEEQARATEPEVAARVARFAEVAELVGRPPAAGTDVERDAAIAAAVGAWTEGDADVTDGPARADELAARRAGARRRWRVAGVAAAALAVVGLGAALVDRLPDGDDDQAGVAADAPADTGAAEGAASGATETDEGSPADTTVAAGDDGGGPSREFRLEGDLGTFEAIDDLVAASRAPAPAARQDSAVLEQHVALLCLPPVPASDADPPTAPLRGATVRTATLGTREVLVVTIAVPDGARVVVFDAADCEVLADRTS